jgi:hypothetical protein
MEDKSTKHFSLHRLISPSSATFAHTNVCRKSQHIKKYLLMSINRYSSVQNLFYSHIIDKT